MAQRNIGFLRIQDAIESKMEIKKITKIKKIEKIEKIKKIKKIHLVYTS